MRADAQLHARIDIADAIAQPPSRVGAMLRYRGVTRAASVSRSAQPLHSVPIIT